MNKKRSAAGIISTLYRFSQKYLNERLSHLNIGSGQYLYLIHLHRYGDGVNQEALTEQLNIDKAITTRVMKKLEEQNYVKRVQDTDDKRSKIIYLTEQGRVIINDIVKVMDSWNELMLEGFTNEEKETLIGYQERMIKNVLDSENVRLEKENSNE